MATFARWIEGASVGLVLFGAIMITAAAIAWAPFAGFLMRSWAIWLGEVSFSLYLIHEPIVVGLGFIAGPNLWWSIPTGIVTSLWVAAVFHRAIKRPSLKLSRMVKALATSSETPGEPIGRHHLSLVPTDDTH